MHLQLPQTLNFPSSRTETLPFHIGRPLVGGVEDEAEQVRGGHTEGHHYLGLVGEKGERSRAHLKSPPPSPAASPSSSTASLGSCSQKQHAQAERKQSQPHPVTTERLNGPEGCLGNTLDKVRCQPLSLARKAHARVKEPRR